jgi:hypothetical protein
MLITLALCVIVAIRPNRRPWDKGLRPREAAEPHLQKLI